MHSACRPCKVMAASRHHSDLNEGPWTAAAGVLAGSERNFLVMVQCRQELHGNCILLGPVGN